MKEEIAQFHQLCSLIPAMTKKGEHIYIYNEKDKIDLFLCALTHGNETIGIYILNCLLKNPKLFEDLSIGFALLNTEAALQGKRFVERDLNRCFSFTTHTAEDQIAKEIAPWLQKSKVVLDLHQTQEDSLSPFYIFDYSEKQHAFAESLGMKIPIIASVGEFDPLGMPLEEYASSQGATALTIELGKRGFNQERMEIGAQICINCMELLQGEKFPRIKLEPLWMDHYYSYDGRELMPGLKNLQFVKEGELIGENLTAPHDAALIFPNYNKEEGKIMVRFARSDKKKGA